MATYNSSTDLSLGQVPDITNFEELYVELLDIHNAIEAMLVSMDVITNQQRAFSSPIVVADYSVLLTDGTVRVDATAGDITITLPPVAQGPGYTYNIKRIDTVGSNLVTIVGDGSELIDSEPLGIDLSTESNYTVTANDTGYDIV